MPRATVRSLTQLVKGPSLDSSQWFETIWARPGTPFYVDPNAETRNGFIQVQTTGAGSFYMKQLDSSFVTIKYQSRQTARPGSQIALPAQPVVSQNRDVTVASGRTFWAPVADLAIEPALQPAPRGPSVLWAVAGGLGSLGATLGLTRLAIRR